MIKFVVYKFNSISIIIIICLNRCQRGSMERKTSKPIFATRTIAMQVNVISVCAFKPKFAHSVCAFKHFLLLKPILFRKSGFTRAGIPSVRNYSGSKSLTFQYFG